MPPSCLTRSSKRIRSQGSARDEAAGEGSRRRQAGREVCRAFQGRADEAGRSRRRRICSPTPQRIGHRRRLSRVGRRACRRIGRRPAGLEGVGLASARRSNWPIFLPSPRSRPRSTPKADQDTRDADRKCVWRPRRTVRRRRNCKPTASTRWRTRIPAGASPTFPAPPPPPPRPDRLKLYDKEHPELCPQRKGRRRRAPRPGPPLSIAESYHELHGNIEAAKSKYRSPVIANFPGTPVRREGEEGAGEPGG